MASRLVLSLLLASSAAALDEQRLPPLPGAPAKSDSATLWEQGLPGGTLEDCNRLPHAQAESCHRYLYE